ncbi:MAG: flavodoxin-dependent (E)-4-hydroxy-3-methylbut-2-enyl-diphosphate synthase [Candidatus Omnitrophota bacterium]|jgi:(E)-4-hydroxy-3-methylbut-2-enyl-diphosphate synthase
MKIIRRKTRVVEIGNVAIGKNNPVAIQSMVKCRTADIEASVTQIKALQDVGCEIIRVAVKDSVDAQAIRKIREKISIPLVADIHFNWKLALEAIENGADKIRLNPGNIYKKEQVRDVIYAAKSAHIPIRVGLNSGSLPRIHRRSLRIPERMVQSALTYIRMIEKMGFSDIVVSLKASLMLDTLEAYRLMAGVCDYPFHIGVTATGLPLQGMISSSIATASLLLDGIGDTMRISLTDAPAEEIKVAKCILESVGLRNFGPQIISCPTCGRCEVNLVKIVNDLERALHKKALDKAMDKPMRIAVMGCVVNGPGEAQEADIGIAFGKKEGLLFKHGKSVRKISPESCVAVLLKEISKR